MWNLAHFSKHQEVSLSPTRLDTKWIAATVNVFKKLSSLT